MLSLWKNIKHQLKPGQIAASLDTTSPSHFETSLRMPKIDTYIPRRFCTQTASFRTKSIHGLNQLRFRGKIYMGLLVSRVDGKEILMRLEKGKQLIEPCYFRHRVTLKCSRLALSPIPFSRAYTIICLKTEIASMQNDPSSLGVGWISANQPQV